MDAVWGFLREAGAWFVGTGAVLVGLRFLSETTFGHWLARGLVRYTAQVETEEQRKRHSWERLDRSRSEAISRLMTKVASCNVLLASVVTMDGLPREAGPEIAYLQHMGKVYAEIPAIGQELFGMLHLFDPTEPLVNSLNQWILETTANADRYHDALQAVLSDSTYWTGAV